MAAELAKRSTGSSSSSPGWLTSILLNKMMNSLQVCVNDVHIRIEADSVVSGGPPVAIGLLCQCISSRRDESGAGQQMLQVRGLSVYWDRDVEMMCLDDPGLAELSALFDKWGKAAETADSVPSVHEDEDGDIFYVAPSDQGSLSSVQHHWVVLPCDLDVRGSLSQCKLVVCSEALPVVLEVGQIWDIFRLLDWLEVVAIRSKYLHLRPRVSVWQDRRAWWQYATAAVLHDMRQRRWRLRWADVRVHLGQRREYAQLYQLVLANRASAQDRVQLEYLESQVASLPLCLAPCARLQRLPRSAAKLPGAMPAASA